MVETASVIVSVRSDHSSVNPFSIALVPAIQNMVVLACAWKPACGRKLIFMRLGYKRSMLPGII